MGWNTVLPNNVTGNTMQISQQLTYIGLLLYDIRALLAHRDAEEPDDE
jgi:hypothetical protein